MVPLLLLPLLLGGEDPEYQLRVKESVTVQEGLCVHVPCSFSYPWKWWYPRTMLYIYWFREKDTSSNHYPVATNNPQRAVKTEARGRFRLVGDPWAYNCSLKIRDAMRSDEGVYFFRVERGEKVRYTYTHTTMTLRVAALTQEPDIHFPEPLKSGWPAELTCSLPGSCEGERPLTFSWVGAALDSLDPETLHSSVLAFTPRLQDHGTNLTCQVKLPEVQATVERTTWLNVSYAPHNLTISIFSNVTALSILENTSSLLIWEGQALRLLCAAASNPPAELSWFRGSPALNATPMYRTHILELPQVGAAEEGVLTCRAQNSLGSQHVSLRLSVVCSPRLLGPSCSWEGEALGCTCSARALPAPTLRWRLGEGLLEGNHSDASLTVTSSSEGPWANSSLSLRGPLGSDLRLICEARNEHGAQSTAVLVLRPDKPEPRASGVLGAVGGAGIMTLLLSLCLCLIFRVKTLRKRAAQPVQIMDLNPAGDSGSGAHRHRVLTDIPADPPAPAGTSPISGEEQELHYAFLRFPKLKPREQEGVNTEYSEIKTYK